jgi:hypothetical protein
MLSFGPAPRLPSRSLTARSRTLILVVLAELARLRLWPQLKHARYSRFGRLAITPIVLKNPAAGVRKQAVNGFLHATDIPVEFDLDEALWHERARTY